MHTRKVRIIAEAGVNHNGSLELALKLIDVAADAGADVVKFQSFVASNLVSANAPKAAYQNATTSPQQSQLEMLKSLELKPQDYVALIEHCKKRGIQFLSTPFDFESLQLLIKKFQLSEIKLPSGEITNAPFLVAAAQNQKPILLSTGMSTVEEIEQALSAIAFGYLNNEKPSSLEDLQKAYRSDEGQKLLQKNVTLFHCVTEYPAPFEEVNLRAMGFLKKHFGLPVGLSDHTMGIAIPLAAAALGAEVIEKHFTLSRSMTGPDHKASLEPEELKQMVQGVRQIELAMGQAEKKPTTSEMKNRVVARKSLVASKPIRSGEPFTEGNLSLKRPGSGITPFEYWNYLGRKAKRDYKEGDLVEA